MCFHEYKFHAVCSVQGVFKSVEISKASVHDIHYLKDMKTQLFDFVLIGDKGYLNREQQLELFSTAKIKLEVPMRENQINYQKRPYLFIKTSKKTETLFSQLCDPLMIRRNYAKFFKDLKLESYLK